MHKIYADDTISFYKKFYFITNVLEILEKTLCCICLRPDLSKCKIAIAGI